MEVTINYNGQAVTVEDQKQRRQHHQRQKRGANIKQPLDLGGTKPLFFAFFIHKIRSHFDYQNPRCRRRRNAPVRNMEYIYL